MRAEGPSVAGDENLLGRRQARRIEGGNVVADRIEQCRVKSHLYSEREREFLRSISPNMNLSPAQDEWLKALAEREPLDFAAINAAALGVLETICRRWLPDGVVYGNEFVARNPNRADGNHGSFRINLNSGKWADFALSDARGGDPISLAAYLFHSGDQIAAARDVKRMVGL